MDEFSLLSMARPLAALKQSGRGEAGSFKAGKLKAEQLKAENLKEGSLKKTEDIKKGAKAFESYFVQSLLKEMRKGIKKGEQGGSGYGDGMYQSMFDEAIANNIAERGGIGLSEMLIEHLSNKSR